MEDSIIKLCCMKDSKIWILSEVGVFGPIGTKSHRIRKIEFRNSVVSNYVDVIH